MDDDLQKLREEIDRLDQEIQERITARAVAARSVAEVKAKAGEAKGCYRPEREAQVLRAVQERNEGPLSDIEIARLFREIMSACLALEQPLMIAYLGPEGTYTQEAALKHFGHSVSVRPMSGIDEVFREVESGAANFGVVPVENSTEGVINHTLDMFLSSSLKIIGEVDLRIHHHLLSSASELGSIAKVLAHQQALAQCREWLDQTMPAVEREAVSSNAEAARLASEDATVGAIASQSAGDLYQLRSLASNIEDHPDNTTRFLIVGESAVAPSGEDKTSILVATANRSGALANLITPLSEFGVNMTRIESRPSRQGMWEYVFFVDLEGHQQDEKVAKALDAIASEATMVRVLGSYPKAVL